VRRDKKFGVAPAEQNVRVMVEAFGDFADAINETEAFGEIRKLEFFRKFIVSDRPVL
jgi:hypothetical protein